MRPLLFLASIAALGLLPSRSITPERGPALRTSGAAEYIDRSAGMLTQGSPPPAPSVAPAAAPADSAARSRRAGTTAPPAAPIAQKLKAMPQSTQWFHPAGHSCPAWEYEAGTSAAAEKARVGCQRYSLRWLNGAPCVPRRGPSIPSC